MALGLIRNLFLVGGTHDGANLLFGDRRVLLNLFHDEITSKEEADYTTDDENANQGKDKNPNLNHD